MNKKILYLIAIAFMAVVPFKASALEDGYQITNDGVCKVYTDYFLFHMSIESWAFEQNGPDSYNKTQVSDESSNTAYFKTNNDYKDAVIIGEDGQIIEIVNTTTANTNQFKLQSYNNIWFNILNQNKYSDISNYYIENPGVDDINTTYYIHSSNTSSSGQGYSEPIFWRSDDGEFDGYHYNSLTPNQKDELKSDIFNDEEDVGKNTHSYYLNATTNIEWHNNNLSDTQVFTISRDYTLNSSQLSRCLNLTKYYRYAGVADNDDWNYRSCIMPDMYKIEYYYPEECESSSSEGENTGTTTKYKVTYHANNGTNTTNSFPVASGDKHYIIENPFTREGYNFIGWSEDKDAKQPGQSPHYDVGHRWIINGNLDLYAVWQKIGEGKEPIEEGDEPGTGLGYSIGIIGTILAATGGGVVYFKKRNKFENI